MKKMMLALAATVMMSVSVMAQDEAQPQRERRDFNPEQMAQKRTEAMVKKYGLSEEQAAKVLELNIKQGQQMQASRQHRGGQDMRRGGHKPMANDSLSKRPRPQRMDKEGMKRPEQGDVKKGERSQQRMDVMHKQMEEYDNALKEIMTEEQFKVYQADREKRMKEGGPRGPRGPRPQEQTQKQ